MKPPFSPSCDHSCVKMAHRFASRRYSLKNKLGDRMIKQLLNLVIAKYPDLSVSRRSIICRSRRLRQIIIDLLTTDKSRYFAQPRPITGNYLTVLLWPAHTFVAMLQNSKFRIINSIAVVLAYRGIFEWIHHSANVLNICNLTYKPETGFMVFLIFLF